MSYIYIYDISHLRVNKNPLFVLVLLYVFRLYRTVIGFHIEIKKFLKESN